MRVKKDMHVKTDMHITNATRIAIDCMQCEVHFEGRLDISTRASSALHARDCVIDA